MTGETAFQVHTAVAQLATGGGSYVTLVARSVETGILYCRLDIGFACTYEGPIQLETRPVRLTRSIGFEDGFCPEHAYKRDAVVDHP